MEPSLPKLDKEKVMPRVKKVFFREYERYRSESWLRGLREKNDRFDHEQSITAA